MKNQKFNIKLEVVLSQIKSRLDKEKVGCIRSDTSLVIYEGDSFDMIKDIISNTVAEIFDKKPSKVCKLNRFEGNVYVRFKKAH
jgi:hypothetical protein